MNTKSSILLCMIIIVSVLSTSSQANSALEPWTYSENFESRELSAWASYPLWQDTAYDDNFRVNTMIPGDSNISIEQMVTPYSYANAYAGAQKKLDMYMVPGSTISLRYYLKTHLPVEYVKVRIGAGADGKVDYTVSHPPTNKWVWLKLNYRDFFIENPGVPGKDRLEVNGIAVCAKVPDADPDMPIYFGLDDIVIKGARTAHFKFSEPLMHKLSEWKPYISDIHYKTDDLFTLRGTWPFAASQVTLTIAPFTDCKNIVIKTNLRKNGGYWILKGLKLTLAPGLYLATLKAFDKQGFLSETQFTMYIAPPSPGDRHPRLWFNASQKERIKAFLKSEMYHDVAEEITSQALRFRKDYPLDTMVYDFDQFPDEDWLVTRYAWSRDRTRNTGESAYRNALAYALLDDREAGEYTKNLLVTYAGYPSWNHPWMIKRGRHFYLLMGDMAMYFALGYDLTCELMDDYERKLVRDSFMKHVIIAAHKAYVDANLVTNHTSNWIAAIMGGSVMCQAAIYGEEPDTVVMEPYFTGSILKEYAFIQHVIGSDGGYGEGYNYYHYSSRSWSKSLPALENVFRVDLSEKLNGAYTELAWAGLIKDKKFFYFGDSRGDLRPMEAWAWLLPKYKDPLLGLMYYSMNMDKDQLINMRNVTGKGESGKNGTELFSNMKNKTLMDLIYDTENVPLQDPFDENPVRLFKDIGTTVFKSGWNTDDFVFVMRTGPFYNHQHLDQGTFWLADHGTVFIEERHGSAYYDDPLYESHYTQPIAHSTVLIDYNHQSQRTGDPLSYIDGFNDHAFVYHFLDGENAAFSSGDIGRLYRGKVKDLKRNVLYLKPRTLLMLDTIVPSEEDVDVTLLYQAGYLKNINADNDVSTITKDGAGLYIKHLTPGNLLVEATEMPHFLREYDSKPLVRNGYLDVTARTAGKPLVIGNLLTTLKDEPVNITTEDGSGFICGKASEIPFAFTTDPGKTYDTGLFITDALALTWSDKNVFAALCTTLQKNGTLLIESQEPVTCEISADRLTYYLAGKSMIAIGVASRPRSIFVDGESVTFLYDPDRKAAMFTLNEGEGTVTFE